METAIIKKIVSDHFNVSIELMEAQTRQRPIAIARQSAMMLMYNYSGKNLKEIGLEFGGRDHTTVIHAKEVVRNIIFTDKAFRRSYEALVHKVELAETPFEKLSRHTRETEKAELAYKRLVKQLAA